MFPFIIIYHFRNTLLVIWRALCTHILNKLAPQHLTISGLHKKGLELQSCIAAIMPCTYTFVCETFSLPKQRERNVE